MKGNSFDGCLYFLGFVKRFPFFEGISKTIPLLLKKNKSPTVSPMDCRRGRQFSRFYNDANALRMISIDHERRLCRVDELIFLREIFQKVGKILLPGWMEMESGFIQKKKIFIRFRFLSRCYKVDIERQIPQKTRWTRLGRVVNRCCIAEVDVEEFPIDP